MSPSRPSLWLTPTWTLSESNARFKGTVYVEVGRSASWSGLTAADTTLHLKEIKQKEKCSSGNYPSSLRSYLLVLLDRFVRCQKFSLASAKVRIASVCRGSRFLGAGTRWPNKNETDNLTAVYASARPCFRRPYFHRRPARCCTPSRMTSWPLCVCSVYSVYSVNNTTEHPSADAPNQCRYRCLPEWFCFMALRAPERPLCARPSRTS